LTEGYNAEMTAPGSLRWYLRPSQTRNVPPGPLTIRPWPFGPPLSCWAPAGPLPAISTVRRDGETISEQRVHGTPTVVFPLGSAFGAPGMPTSAPRGTPPREFAETLKNCGEGLLAASSADV